MKLTTAAILSLAGIASAETFLKEQFDDSWSDRWTVSTDWKSKSDMGEWKHTAGEWYGDEADKGIQTGEDAKFYGISAPLSKPFKSSDGKDLVIQFAVKHEQKIDCGGAYIKLLPGGAKFAPAKFGGDTPYAVMFGPDICGTSNKKTHAILHYDKKDDNLLVKNEITVEDDQLSHLYTLVVRPDNTFEVFIDNKSVRDGKLEEEFDFLPAKEIKDPDQSKPDDWVDEKKIADPEDKKPDGYDDIPEEIADPEAKKPDDWDDEDDGEWEPPMIDNPDYKGAWKPNMIDNPDYKGPWEHPMIANSEYAYDDNMHAVCSGDGCTHVGFELWQVKSGTIFDDILIVDSLEEAQKFAEETFFKKQDGEKKMFDEIEEAKRKEEEANMPDDMDGMGGMGDMDGMGGMDDDGFGDEF